jgi:hypothetical protein
VLNGKWTWPGLKDEAWKQRPDVATDALKRLLERQPKESDDQWRSRQFHVLHVQRVLARETGMAGGNEEGELSCSSCHKSFDPIDRTTPATTCAGCHNGNNGQMDAGGTRHLIATNAPNCSSCHTQHIKQPGHWNQKLLAPAALPGLSDTSMRDEPQMNADSHGSGKEMKN